MIEVKERAGAASPALDPRQALAAARQRLADEWRLANPTTPEEIAAFYCDAKGYGADLEAWHATPERKVVTEMLVHVALESAARTILDIGCGAAHDLRALSDALPRSTLHGVEPNWRLRELAHAGKDNRYAIHAAVEYAPIESADMLLCIDVLEHVPDPETFLGGIAQRAKLGCILFETTATHDTGTPLHLKENWGWHPGRVLERHGWEVVDRTDRVRVWRREAQTGRQRASLLLCAYRSVDLDTMQAIMFVTGDLRGGWRFRAKGRDALISRSRSIIVTSWWRETNDDVFVMVDDDVVFNAADADRLAELCRNGYDIVCGAYPVHNGAHLACRCFPGTGDVAFGPGQPLVEIQYAATGFMAVHRRVLDALIPTLPLCHAAEPWSFYPLFQPAIVEDAAAGGYSWLSEDWGFSEMARQAGFRVWLDPQTKLTHMGAGGISVSNMAAMHAALKQV